MTGIVEGYYLTGGSWAGGDAAGKVYFRMVSRRLTFDTGSHEPVVGETITGVSCDFVNGVCFSGTSTRSNLLLDSDELGEISDIAAIPGITITYDENPEPAPEPYNNINTYDDLSTDKAVFVPALNHVLWAASLDSEFSYGAKVNGIPRNIYIYLWCLYIRTYGLVKSRWQIDNLLTYKLLSIVPQHCQLEGPSTELYQKPFT